MLVDNEIHHGDGYSANGMVDFENGVGTENSARTRNNQAQKRYRDRRKKEREDLEDKMSVLSTRISQLQCTQESLAARNRSLERLSQIADAKDDTDTAVPGVRELSVLARQLALQASPQALFDCDASRQFAKLMTEEMNIGRHPDDQLSAEDAQEWMLDPDKLNSYRVDLCRALYALCGQTLHPVPEAKRRVEALMSRAQVLRTKMYAVVRDGPLPHWIIQQRLACHQSENQDQIAEALPHVTANLELTEIQKAQLIKARRQYLIGVDALSQKRSPIVDQLKMCNSQGTGDSAASVFEGIQQSALAQGKLADNLVQLAMYLRDFSHTCREILTPWQEAKCLMDSYINFGVVIPAWESAVYLEMESRKHGL